jgi:hypothetical protein
MKRLKRSPIALLLLLTASAWSQALDRPNVILVMTDDQATVI